MLSPRFGGLRNGFVLPQPLEHGASEICRFPPRHQRVDCFVYCTTFVISKIGPSKIKTSTRRNGVFSAILTFTAFEIGRGESREVTPILFGSGSITRYDYDLASDVGDLLPPSWYRRFADVIISSFTIPLILDCRRAYCRQDIVVAAGVDWGRYLTLRALSLEPSTRLPDGCP